MDPRQTVQAGESTVRRGIRAAVQRLSDLFVSIYPGSIRMCWGEQD
jgi:hypothetical protein